MKGRTYRYFTDALFPFGYGLSYTRFEVGEAKITNDGSGYKVTVPVKNIGKREGTETIQLYIRDLQDKEGPLKSLRAFQRVSLKAGESSVVNLQLTPRSFEFWDSQTNTMRVKNGQFEIFYGTSSRDADLKTLKMTR